MNVFVPLRTQSSPSRRAVVAKRGGVAPAPRLGQRPGGEPLAGRRLRAGSGASAPRCRRRGCARSRARCATRPSARSSRRPARSPRRRWRSSSCPSPSRRTPRGCGSRAGPCAASLGTSSVGKRSSLSQRWAWGAISARANSRTLWRRRPWCSEKSKSMTVGRNDEHARAAPAQGRASRLTLSTQAMKPSCVPMQRCRWGRRRARLHGCVQYCEPPTLTHTPAAQSEPCDARRAQVDRALLLLRLVRGVAHGALGHGRPRRGSRRRRRGSRRRIRRWRRRRVRCARGRRRPLRSPRRWPGRRARRRRAPP